LDVVNEILADRQRRRLEQAYRAGLRRHFSLDLNLRIDDWHKDPDASLVRILGAADCGKEKQGQTRRTEAEPHSNASHSIAPSRADHRSSPVDNRRLARRAG